VKIQCNYDEFSRVCESIIRYLRLNEFSGAKYNQYDQLTFTSKGVKLIQTFGEDQHERNMGHQSLYEFLADGISPDCDKVIEALRSSYTEHQLKRIKDAL
jgi:hypothetical protein